MRCHRASMSEKVCIVTGANSGIGKETALGLSQMGARVVMVCRNVEKGKAALEEIRRESGSSQDTGGYCRATTIISKLSGSAAGPLAPFSAGPYSASGR